MISVQVSRKGAGRVDAGHPWIFSSDVLDSGGAAPGSAVKVSDPRGRILGTAHYSSSSQITLRMLSDHSETVDRAFFLRRIAGALEYRKIVVRNTEAWRAVYGEGDLLPGLVVDCYGPVLVVQMLDQGMDAARADILSCLTELLAPQAIVLRNDASVRAHEQLPLEAEVAHGALPSPVVFRMNSLEFRADLLKGQKTGIYLDQRENYLAAAAYARGRVLDCFTSSGGFALHMAGRVESVEAVDSSAEALDLAAQNGRANGAGNIEFRQANVFDLLSGYDAAHRKFDMVVLDPPAFAKSRGVLESAARGYKEINRRALRLLEPGGTLVTCSCSHHVSEAMLLQIVAEAALDTRRMLRIVERRTQARDHPILLTVPETHYLKCLIAQVL